MNHVAPNIFESDVALSFLSDLVAGGVVAWGQKMAICIGKIESGFDGLSIEVCALVAATFSAAHGNDWGREVEETLDSRRWLSVTFGTPLRDGLLLQNPDHVLELSRSVAEYSSSSAMQGVYNDQTSQVIFQRRANRLLTEVSEIAQ